MKKFLLIFFFFSSFALNLSAQNEIDALRYSQLYQTGTARAMAMGGSFGALGADFSTLSSNPAGIGIYQNTEISFSPSIYFSVMKSNYNNSVTDDRKYNFNLGSLGAVIVIKPKKEGKCKAVQFGIGYNKLQNYNYNAYIEGNNGNNSILDDFIADAQGIEPKNLNEFSTMLAFNTYLIDTSGGLTNYVSPIPLGGIQQMKSISASGSSNELVISLGGNFNDKLYIGATFGFPYVRYVENTTYEEFDKGDSIPDFKKLTYNQNLETHGSGFNFKIGAIYRITDWMRIGAAVHTPTFFSLKDKWSSEMFSELGDGAKKYEAYSPEGRFDYQLTTPFRANAALSFVIGKYALITGEYEFVDYSSATLKSTTYRFRDENKAIDNKYTFQSNVKAGFEVKINQISLRGGYQFNSSPYAKKLNDGKRHAFGGGAGVKFDRFFLDAAYTFIMSKEEYYLYKSVPTAVENKLNAHNILLTFGVKL